MKELGGEPTGELPGRVLKSLLKKPGQAKPKAQRNRVVINEKLNEFFAADYIILIKEECCAEYEEECDCCCQEHEMIRLGSCKECRAELNLHLAAGVRFAERDSDADADGDGGGGREQVFGNEGLQVEDDGPREVKRGGQQQETLSPPEGYKDVCEESEAEEHALKQHPAVCTECSYYRERAGGAEEHSNIDGTNGESKSNSPEVGRSAVADSLQDTSDQAQQTTPDSHQRYLVETITMTTVTERRIVREISEEETAPKIDETDNPISISPEVLKNGKLSSSLRSVSELEEENVGSFEDSKLQGADGLNNKSVGKSIGVGEQGGTETADASELSLTFKLANTSLVTNSLKPNSAVRQLFPDPRFISPPPAPAKVVPCGIPEDSQDGADPEAQKFLITTESLRLFDAVKRSKLAGDSDSEPMTIKRTIERNALRRSLICKYESSTKKKNLRSKDLTLEERIRQLTCVDLDDQDTESSASENATISDSKDYMEFPVRTSPSGEESTTEPSSRAIAVTAAQEYNPANAFSQTNAHHSTYKKITDLFAQKKSDSISDSMKNLPDLGIGNKLPQAKDYPSKAPVAKMNSDARKQFLASLAPLSCVAATAMDSREDYYQLSSKMTSSNRDSVAYNSDSSYSLEDIEAALRGEERNYKNAGGPPDVTRGTPTSTAPDDDSTTDELLAFVEQDKSRTERIKKRYNDAEERQDDDDDELNDYGFNRRPSVRGIKPQFGSTNEIIRQLQSRNVAPNSFVETKTGSHMSWPYYDNEDDKQKAFAEAEDDTYQMITDGRDNNTINRINTMQKQIDDIYQTIAETSVSVQGTLKRGSYLESTLPRPLSRIPVGEDAHRYSDPKNGIRFQDPLAAGARMLRIAGGGDGAPGGIYSSLPNKSRRHTAIALSSYQCGVVPSTESKCYRTMYLVPYNGMTDPTYQNIQRILPSHASANYANHIERYPYPRNAMTEQQQQQQSRYYARPAAPATPPLHSQSALHLHLHQPDDFRVPNTLAVHSQQLQHQQAAGYNVQPILYSVANPMRGAGPGGGYSYPVHVGRSAADVQTQTVSVPASTSSSSLSTYSNPSQHCTTNSAVLSSPTKMQQQRAACAAGERGVPEGAASVPAQDFPSNPGSTQSTMAFMGHPNNMPPPNTQNSVYYAMNV